MYTDRSTNSFAKEVVGFCTSKYYIYNVYIH